MRYEGESYKRKIINSYPQDLIPCSASTTESLIDLLPLLHQLSSLGRGSEWRWPVFAVNIRIIRKAWANKRDGGHWPMAAVTVAYIVGQTVVDTGLLQRWTRECELIAKWIDQLQLCRSPGLVDRFVARAALL